MIPAWLGIPGLVVVFISFVLVAILSAGSIIDKIIDNGLGSFLKGILKERRWILFLIIFYLLTLIGSMYLAQLLSH